MTDRRISKDLNVDSIQSRKVSGLPLVPVDPVLSSSPIMGNMVFDPNTLRPYYGTGTQWVSLGTLRSISQGTGIVCTPNPIVSTGTVSLANTAVVPGTYGNATNVAQFTVDQQGRLTAASNVLITPQQQVWAYFYTPGVGNAYPANFPLPIWDGQQTGAAGFMSGATYWTAQQAGTYRIDVTVASGDLINPNTITLRYIAFGGPDIPLGADHTPPQLAFMKINNMFVMNVGDIVYVSGGDLGVVTQGTAPSQGRSSILLITKVR